MRHVSKVQSLFLKHWPRITRWPKISAWSETRETETTPGRDGLTNFRDQPWYSKQGDQHTTKRKTSIHDNHHDNINALDNVVKMGQCRVCCRGKEQLAPCEITRFHPLFSELTQVPTSVNDRRRNSGSRPGYLNSIAVLFSEWSTLMVAVALDQTNHRKSHAWPNQTKPNKTSRVIWFEAFHGLIHHYQ